MRRREAKRKRRGRWRLWRPILRPRSGRRLPRGLRVDRVGRLAAELPGGVRDPGFAVLLRRIDESPVLGGNRVRIFVHGPETFEAMRAAIGAAARGVSVRVLADAFGSIATRRDFWNEMRERGIEVRLFNPLFPHLLLQPFRDHRKILVIDGETAFTGGMNIGDEYGSSLSTHGGPWRDTHV